MNLIDHMTRLQALAATVALAAAVWLATFYGAPLKKDGEKDASKDFVHGLWFTTKWPRIDPTDTRPSTVRGLFERVELIALSLQTDGNEQSRGQEGYQSRRRQERHH